METNVTRIRRKLTLARNELARKLRRIRRDSVHGAQPLPADADDRASLRENDEVLAGLDAPVETLLAEYEHALHQLEAGEYGTCETCGYEIESERLKAVPYATRCASCATAARASAPDTRRNV